MLGKAALLVKSKVAIAVLGVLVAGTGGAVALAATGHMPSLPALPNATQAANSHTNDNNHAHTVAIEGTLKAYDSGAKTISVLANNATSATTISVDGQTLVNGARATQLSDLTANIGHKVQVQATKQSNGSLLAWKITIGGAPDDHSQGTDNRHQIVGTITSVNANGIVVKLATGHEVTVTVDGQTSFVGAASNLAAIKVGMRAEVQGTIQNDGSMQASNIQAQNGGQGAGQSNSQGSGH